MSPISSSSLAAIHLACNAIWRNECDTAVAGGTNVMSNPDSFVGLDRGHFLAREGMYIHMAFPRLWLMIFF